MTDTIFALSSGSPPAAIAVIRISGPCAGDALVHLAGHLPAPRRPVLARLHDSDGRMLDEALVLWMPGSRSATGEDLAELHCHGGRAVVAAVLIALEKVPGLRAALPGEFTRRAFANGRIDLSEAEGLADLLSAETELQRSAAIAMAAGGFSGQIEAWRGDVLTLGAEVEAALDFSDEDDVGEVSEAFTTRLASLLADLGKWLERPRAERLAEGYRVVLAGPPNAGKSSLFNALIEIDAAIVTPIAGTTRDVIERPCAIAGVPFTFVDTAGLHDEAGDAVEAIGVARAQLQLASADLVLWLGEEGEGPPAAWEIESKIDVAGRCEKAHPDWRVSSTTGAGITALRQALVEAARSALPRPGEAALNARQHGLLAEARGALEGIAATHDLLLIAEHLRVARSAFDRLVGRSTTEDMLDALFGRFCIGK